MTLLNRIIPYLVTEIILIIHNLIVDLQFDCKSLNRVTKL